VEGVIENLGLLKYEETADLYRRCAVGLAMMATPHPSYLPFEFMATGCLPVGIQNPGTKWFYKHEQNCLLSEASTTCLTDTLEKALCEETMRANIARNALNKYGRTTVIGCQRWRGFIVFSVRRNRARI
jgi:O-antigen biosynthesis protein